MSWGLQLGLLCSFVCVSVLMAQDTRTVRFGFHEGDNEGQGDDGDWLGGGQREEAPKGTQIRVELYRPEVTTTKWVALPVREVDLPASHETPSNLRSMWTGSGQVSKLLQEPADTDTSTTQIFNYETVGQGTGLHIFQLMNVADLFGNPLKTAHLEIRVPKEINPEDLGLEHQAEL